MAQRKALIAASYFGGQQLWEARKVKNDIKVRRAAQAQ